MILAPSRVNLPSEGFRYPETEKSCPSQALSKLWICEQNIFLCDCVLGGISVIYCFVTNHPKTQRLKTLTILGLPWWHSG